MAQEDTGKSNADLEARKKRRKSRSAKKNGHKNKRTSSKKTDSAKSDDLDPRFVSQTGKVIAGRYLCMERLGKGGDGVVYRGMDQETEEYVAIKQIPLDERTDLKELMKEIDFMKECDHPNIVKYYNHVEENANLFLIIEFMENGSLARIVKERGGMPEDLISMYMEQVLEGLAYLHERGVAHRDIKGDNLLTTAEGTIKLADFGVAINVEAYVRPDNTLDASVVGTPYWMGPEVIQIQNPTVKSDLWAVGCTIVELITGAPPYYDLGSMAAMFRIVEDKDVPLPPKISKSLSDFLKKCFVRDPENRASAKELLQHKWIQHKGTGTISALPSLQNVSEFVANYNAERQNGDESNPTTQDEEYDEDEEDNDNDDEGDDDEEGEEGTGTVSESAEDSTDKATSTSGKAVSFAASVASHENNKVTSTATSSSVLSNQSNSETNKNREENSKDEDEEEEELQNFRENRKAFLEYITNLSEADLNTKGNKTLVQMVMLLRDELRTSQENMETMEVEMARLRAKQNSLVGKILYKLPFGGG